MTSEAEKRELEERVLRLAPDINAYIHINGTEDWPESRREVYREFHRAVSAYQEKVLGLVDVIDRDKWRRGGSEST